MFGFRTEINLFHFLQGIGVICLLGISQITLASVNQIISVKMYPSSTHTRVAIESHYVLKYKQFILIRPKRVVIDLKNINIKSVIKETGVQSHDDPYIQSIRIGQFDLKTVRIVFNLKENTKPQLFTSLLRGLKEHLIMDLYPLRVTDVKNPILTLIENCGKIYSRHHMKFLKRNSNFTFNKNKRKYNRPIIIMLDPGHGGEDSGAIGKCHTREKDVVLQIARRLKALIENEDNMHAYMERNEDIFVPLKVRVIKARKRCADLFISIHADAFPSRQSSGSSVFALSNKGATNIADRYFSNTQNSISNFISGIDKSGDRYLDYTMFEMVQSLTIRDSLKFAKVVLDNLRKINKLHKNIVGQAEFEVLKAPDIPSILIETAFISNVEEEHKLKTAKFQQKMAESILAGIKTYISDKKI